MVKCKIDTNRRERLTVHHTATHIINAAARQILGKHIWQHGAHKSPEKAHLDITHYKNLTEKEVNKIEDLSNKIISKGYAVYTEELSRTEAEKRYGVRIYQGGAVPGKVLRIVSIDNIDHEACGGTHVKNTKEVGEIIILKTERIQDGIIRIEFVAGKSAEKYNEEMKKIVDELVDMFDCNRDELIERIKNLKEEWEEWIKKEKKNEKNKIERLKNELTKSVEKFKNERIKVPREVIVQHIKDDTNIQELAKSLQKENRIIILLSGKKKIKIFGISKTDLNVGNFFREICQKFNGKGGGNKNSAQGFVFGDPKEIIKYIKSKLAIE